MIVSTSLDQTSRIYTWWENPVSQTKTWHEVSRAQIHGYDINAIKFLSIQNKLSGPEDKRKLCDLLVCGADEKILRLLEPPSYFINTVNHFTDSKLRLFYPDAAEEQAVLEDKEKFIYKTKTEGGYSVLGLMIKASKPEKVSFYSAVSKDDEEDIEEMESNFDVPYDFKIPPVEDYLFKHTLWPEMNKMYGHGYEIVSISSSPDGAFIASTCKSQTNKHSSIFVWDAKSCQLVQQLTGHNYSVLQVRFSSTGKYLAAVSRDRQTSLFVRNGEGKYENAYLNTTHAKLIYSVAISHDERFVITGSRDKTLKLFEICEKGLNEINSKKMDDSVTALEFGKFRSGDDALLWVGFDCGRIEVWRVKDNGEIERAFTLEGHLGHSKSVLGIRYGFKVEGKDSHVVASCSEDHSLRIYQYCFDG